MFTLMMMGILVMGGEALLCYDCKEFKQDGNVNNNKSVACDDSTMINCKGAQVACLRSKFSFDATAGTLSTKFERTYRTCGEMPPKDVEDFTCKTAREIYGKLPGFICSAKYCKTDLCNAGNAAQLSIFVLAATIGLFGLFF
jgi:hypothetical protein